MSQRLYIPAGTPGNPPAGLTAFGESTTADWTIQDTGGQGLAVEAYKATPDGFVFHGASLDGADSAETEVWVRYLAEAWNTYGLVFVRGSGGANTEAAYALSIDTNGKTGQPYLGINRWGSGIRQIGWRPVLKPKTFASGIVQARFQAFGDTLKARAWLDGTPEPSVWDLTVVDTVLSSAGKVGLMSPSIFSPFKVLAFGVGTDGDSAPSA